MNDMKVIDIVGDNSAGRWTKVRFACRGIVLEEGRILLTHETKTGVWMIPGGGREEGETDKECCVREYSEETGYLIRPSECVLEIDEYYGEEKYVDRYFFGRITGRTELNLTGAEQRAGMEPRWIPVEQALDVFSHHSDGDCEEMTRGLYLREHTALLECLRLPENGRML